jgi:hypothetical protein
MRPEKEVRQYRDVLAKLMAHAQTCRCVICVVTLAQLEPEVRLLDWALGDGGLAHKVERDTAAAARLVPPGPAIDPKFGGEG